MRNYENAKFVVTLRDVYHSEPRLSAKRKGSKKSVVIANGGGELRRFLFDKQRSLIRYITEMNDAIISYDLNTGKKQTLLSFGSFVESNLLDTTPDGALLAFERYGPCEPGKPGVPMGRDIYRICFLSLAP